jgi:flavin-binding protein dodecin
VSDATYKVTEVVGTSSDSIQHAVRNGIARASETLRNLDWFEVTEIRGHIVDSKVGH